MPYLLFFLLLTLAACREEEVTSYSSTIHLDSESALALSQAPWIDSVSYLPLASVPAAYFKGSFPPFVKIIPTEERLVIFSKDPSPAILLFRRDGSFARAIPLDADPKYPMQTVYSVAVRPTARSIYVLENYERKVYRLNWRGKVIEYFALPDVFGDFFHFPNHPDWWLYSESNLQEHTPPTQVLHRADSTFLVQRAFDIVQVEPAFTGRHRQVRFSNSNANVAYFFNPFSSVIYRLTPTGSATPIQITGRTLAADEQLDKMRRESGATHILPVREIEEELGQTTGIHQIFALDRDRLLVGYFIGRVYHLVLVEEGKAQTRAYSQQYGRIQLAPGGDLLPYLPIAFDPQEHCLLFLLPAELLNEFLADRPDAGLSAAARRLRAVQATDNFVLVKVFIAR